MPRTIRSRTANGLYNNFAYTTGHIDPFFEVVSNIVTTAVGYTTGKIKSDINNEVFNPDLTIEEEAILDNLGITSTLDVLVTIDDDTTTSIPSNIIDSGTLTINIPGTATIDIPNNNTLTTIDVGSQEITELVTNESLIPINLLESLYNDFIQPYKDESPYHIGSIQQMTEIYEAVNAIIETSDGDPDVRLLIYRDILEVLTMARDVYTDRIRTDREICIVRIKYYEMKKRVDDLLQELAQCNGTAVSRFCGSLGITIKKPKPLIYAQAILNINMAWYIFLHGTPIKPREYAATVAYVNSLGGRQAAYDKLIELLDERYRDDDQEFQDSAQDTINNTNSSNQDTSSGPCTTDSQTGSSDSGSSHQISSSDCTCSEITSSSDGNCSDYSSGDECRVIVETNKLKPVYRPITAGGISAFVVPGSLSVSIVENPSVRPQTYCKPQATKTKKKRRRHRSDCRKTRKCETQEYSHDSKSKYRPITPGVSAFVVPGELSISLEKSKYWGMRKQTVKHSHSSKRKSKKRHFRKCQFAYYCNKSKKRKHRKNKTCKEDEKPTCQYVCIPTMDCNDLGTAWGFVVPGALSVDVREGFMKNCR